MIFSRYDFYLIKISHLHLVALLLLINILSGCANPVGVKKVSPRESYKLRVNNVLSDGEMSDNTKTVLQRYNLLKTLTVNPQDTIQLLNNYSILDNRRDILFALSELSYLLATKLPKGHSGIDKGKARDLFFQSAVYAYFYLLGDGETTPPTAYDIRFREACDFYNRSLWLAFSTNDDNSLNLTEGVRQTTGGALTLVLNSKHLNWPVDNLAGLYPSDGYKVRGFTVRNRIPGLGLPLIGVSKKTAKSPTGGVVPITAFLRIQGSYSEYHQGKSIASLELYSALDRTEIQVNGRSVPLETDITVPLAYRLEGSKLWTIGEKRFLKGTRVSEKLLFIQPYEPGRIPVVFVHGTASSPVWWAEMVNSLRAETLIRKHFQFWFYQYNTSNLIMLSAAELRESLTDLVHQLDPHKKDPALQNMIMIGHSQGGLLTKMAVVDPGQTLWHSISDKKIDEIIIDEDVKRFAGRLLFFQPLPFVKRVVFISTPHRGSYLTKAWVRSLVRKFVNLPDAMASGSQAFFMTAGSQLKLPSSVKGVIPTSIDGMSEENPLLQSLAVLPLESDVVGHSIISVKPGMDIATGNDGVVEFRSAYIDGVKSNFIVRSGHSCQEHPFTIEEVRRILLEHIGRDNAWQPPAEKTPSPARIIQPN